MALPETLWFHAVPPCPQHASSVLSSAACTRHMCLSTSPALTLHSLYKYGDCLLVQDPHNNYMIRCGMGPVSPTCSAKSPQTWDVDPMFLYCWANVADDGPTIQKHWVKSCICWVISVIDWLRLDHVLTRLWLNSSFPKFAIMWIKCNRPSLQECDFHTLQKSAYLTLKWPWNDIDVILQLFHIIALGLCAKFYYDVSDGCLWASIWNFNSWLKKQQLGLEE